MQENKDEMLFQVRKMQKGAGNAKGEAHIITEIKTKLETSKQ